MAEIKIKIIGWDKINARKDVENPTWFKFKHKFFEDTEFFGFTDSEKLCWIYMLCEASKKNNGGEFTLFTTHAEKIATIVQSTVNSTIKKLHKLQIIEFRTSRGRHADVTSACSRQEEKREEKRREEESCEGSPNPAAAIVGFESLVEIFLERKVGTKIQEGWLGAFPDSEWICSEIRKALAWELSNPGRRKKNFSAFVTRWLTKGWDHRRFAGVKQSVPLDPKKIFGDDHV